MAKRKASEPRERYPKKTNTSRDFVYYQAARHLKIHKVSATKVGKRPVYRFFIDFDGNQFPLRCMLDNGSTSFVISPEAAKAFAIPVVKRQRPIWHGDASGNDMEVENMFTIPLGLSFGNHRSYDEEDHAFEVMKTAKDYDALIPAWYLEKHKARGTTTSHLHFPHCKSECYNHGIIHPEYSITYHKRIALSDKAIHIGAVVQTSPAILSKLPTHYHKFLLLFDPEEAEKLPDNKGCDHHIELLGPEDKLRMGVRGYPLAVIMGLVGSRTAHTTPRLASTRPSGVPFSEGLCQSREELQSWPVARGARIMRGFFHSWILCGTCLRASTAVDSQLQERGLFTA